MNKLRWGVLGTGRIVMKAGPALKRADNCMWLGVAGRNKENSRSAAELYGVERAYDTYQQLIDDPDIDAVYIALLNHLHMEWAIKAAVAGKHVMVEKPVALNAAEAKRIRDAAQKNGVQVMEAFVWRYHPAHIKVKQMIDDEMIGEPMLVNGHFSFVADAASTRLVKEWGGGSLYDVGCYPISWSRYLLGGNPEAVDCRMQFDPSSGVEMRTAAQLYFPGGKTAQISSALDMANGSFYEVLGTRGKLIAEFAITPAEMTITVTCKGESRQWTTDRIEPFVYQADHFADHVLNGKPLPYGIDDAVTQMEIIDALFQADESQSRISLAR